MKTKKLLFGLIEMNGTMYNVLYTLLCAERLVVGGNNYTLYGFIGLCISRTFLDKL